MSGRRSAPTLPINQAERRNRSGGFVCHRKVILQFAFASALSTISP
jgi:hypothetical protein